VAGRARTLTAVQTPPILPGNIRLIGMSLATSSDLRAAALAPRRPLVGHRSINAMLETVFNTLNLYSCGVPCPDQG
jgi:hypothetical protein